MIIRPHMLADVGSVASSTDLILAVTQLVKWVLAVSLTRNRPNHIPVYTFVNKYPIPLCVLLHLEKRREAGPPSQFFWGSVIVPSPKRQRCPQL